MKIRESGRKELPTVVLLHGGGLSWWSLNNVIELLKNDYHVVTPIIDGHGEDGENTFISIEESANNLIQYIEEHLNGEVLAICGLSIGAQIVTEILSKRENISKYAIIESALIIPMKSVAIFTAPMYKLFYGLIQKKWFSKLQAKSLFVPENMFENYYEDSLRISKQSLVNITLSNANFIVKSSLSHTKSKVMIIVGEKELKIMKKSALILHQMIPGSELKIMDGMGHGEISLVHPEKYVDLFYQLVNSGN
ncbi:MAG: alpha/beta hydrolase [Bacillota bacterium]|nr:alpha/beta hydrolase [Bacillota bacterium]